MPCESLAEHVSLFERAFRESLQGPNLIEVLRVEGCLEGVHDFQDVGHLLVSGGPIGSLTQLVRFLDELVAKEVPALQGVACAEVGGEPFLLDDLGDAIPYKLGHFDPIHQRPVYWRSKMSNGPWNPFLDPLGPDEDLLLEKPSVEEQLETDWKVLQGNDPGDKHVPRMSEEKLREFVLGVLDGSLYTSRDVKDQNILPMVFLPLALGGLKDFTKEMCKEVGGFYARMSTSLPRSINGHPIFSEMAVVHRDDWARAWQAIHRESSRRQKMEI